MSGGTQELWQQFGERLDFFIRSRVNNPADAEDLLQETFLRLHRSPPPPGGHLPAWVFTVVRNLITDHYRRNKERSIHPADLNPVQPDRVTQAEAEVAGWLRDLASALPVKYSTAVIMADMEGLTMVQLAERLDLSVSGAKSRVQRGRQLLARNLDQCCQLFFDKQGRVDGWQRRNACDCE